MERRTPGHTTEFGISFYCFAEFLNCPCTEIGLVNDLIWRILFYRRRLAFVDATGDQARRNRVHQRSGHQLCAHVPGCRGDNTGGDGYGLHVYEHVHHD